MSACRVRLSVIMTAWAVYIGPTLTSCDMAILSSCTSPEAVIHNNLFRYGMYCGPGPDDKLWTVTQPVDSIDQICQDHDKAYKSCLVVLSKDAGKSGALYGECALCQLRIVSKISYLTSRRFRHAKNSTPNYACQRLNSSNNN